MNGDQNPAQSDRILIVDDDTGDLHLLTELLAEHGYTAHPASTGELALKFVHATIPDLVLLDIRMPEMDGFEVCGRLKADERTASVPVIFLTVLEDEASKVKGFEAGGVDYITKPFQKAEVLARIKNHIRLRELTERLERTVDERTKELMTANQRLQQEILERRQAEEELRILNEELDRRVKERTRELEAKNAELQQTMKIFVGRELRMIELKEKIRKLEEKTGETGTARSRR
jgi:DNA-binding response OmpR family regulator